MADYYSQGHTNYFSVKDGEKFEQEVNSFKGDKPIELHKEGDKYCLLFEEGLPTIRYNEEGEEEVGGSVVEELVIKQHLADGSVCVIMDVFSAEKPRLIDGWAVAFNNRGDRKIISLDDIYNGIESFGECTRREYQ